MASAVGPRSPKASRERTRFAAVSSGQTIRSVVTLAPTFVAISLNRRRCSSDLNDPTAITSLFLARESVTAAPIAEYACSIASLLRSPEAVRAVSPNTSAKVSDAKLTAPHRSAARSAGVDFPDPGEPKQEQIMISKKKSDQPRKSDRSEADLRQKEAELEKASKEELKHMGDAKAAQAAREQKEKKKSK
jgi:hypothetical protein